MRSSTILGRSLWNLFYDGLLCLRLPEGVSVRRFAVDVVLVTVNHTMEGLERSTNNWWESTSRATDYSWHTPRLKRLF